jgi:SOS response regulatory protein OraA/RecX
MRPLTPAECSPCFNRRRDVRERLEATAADANEIEAALKECCAGTYLDEQRRRKEARKAGRRY